MRLKLLLRYALPALAVSLTILAVLAWFLRPGDLLQAAGRIDYRYLPALAAAALGLELGLGPLIWWTVIRGMGEPIRLRPVWLLYMKSLLAVDLLPARLGELVKAEFLRKRTSLTYTASLGTVVFGYWIELAVVLPVWGLSLALGWKSCGFAAGAPLKLMAAALIVVVAAALIVFRFREAELFRAFTRMGAAVWLRVAAMCSADLFLRLLILYLCLRSFGVEIPILAALILGPMALIAGNLPIALGGLGSREAAIAALFAAWGPSGPLLVAGLAMSLFTVGTTTVLGALFVTGAAAELNDSLLAVLARRKSGGPG